MNDAFPEDIKELLLDLDQNEDGQGCDPFGENDDTDES